MISLQHRQPGSGPYHEKIADAVFNARMFGHGGRSLVKGAEREKFVAWLREVLFIALASIRSVPGLKNTQPAAVEAGIRRNVKTFALMYMDRWKPEHAAGYIMETVGYEIPSSVLSNVSRGAFRDRAHRSRAFAGYTPED